MDKQTTTNQRTAEPEKHRTTTSDSASEPRYRCGLCNQSVEAEEVTAVTIDDSEKKQLCQYCAASLSTELDDSEATAQDQSPSGATTDRDGTAAGTPRSRQVAPAETEGASSVTWSPPRADRGGLIGGLLSIHLASLSLLWAIHRTNVRLIERILDEVDVETLMILVTVLGAVVVLVGALA